MASCLTLSEARKALEDAGIDARTPGLHGEARHRALLERLEEKLSADSREETDVVDLCQEDLPQLSLSEIRRQLTCRGVDTSTPGCSGERRRERLLALLRYQFYFSQLLSRSP
eukprot:scaffold7592_cov277-Pinguiococcus_pyrenoidosus.AAC.1